MHSYARPLSRRRFLGGLTLAGTAGLLGVYPRPVAAEPPPETTRIRLVKYTSACQAPLYLSEELLRTEGFTDVQCVSSKPSQTTTRARWKRLLGTVETEEQLKATKQQ